MRTAILLGILTLIVAEAAVYLLLMREFGFLKVFALDLLSIVAGILILRRQGSRTLMKIRTGLRSGRLPGADILDGAFLFLAASMLLLPGFISDAAGLLLLIPAARRMLAAQLGRGVRIWSQRRTAGPAPASVVELDRHEYRVTEPEHRRPGVDWR